MLTRREEDIAIVGIEDKNTELFFKWTDGKEGSRNAKRTENGQVAGERSSTEGSDVPDGSVSTGRGAHRIEGTEGASAQAEGSLY